MTGSLFAAGTALQPAPMSLEEGDEKGAAAQKKAESEAMVTLVVQDGTKYVLPRAVAEDPEVSEVIAGSPGLAGNDAHVRRVIKKRC
jgi:hypothetical protein